MAYKRTSITEKLDRYRELTLKGLSEKVIAERMELRPAYISHFKLYWCAVDSGVLAEQLIRVIREHNRPRQTAGAMFRLTFDKTIRQPSGLHVVYTDNQKKRVRSRFNVEQQEAALKATFEEAKRLGRIPADVKTIEECEDEELLELDWRTFKRHLKKQSE